MCVCACVSEYACICVCECVCECVLIMLAVPIMCIPLKQCSFSNTLYCRFCGDNLTRSASPLYAHMFVPVWVCAGVGVVCV